MTFRAFEQIKIIKHQWTGIIVCFTVQKFTGTLRTRQNKARALQVFYREEGIQPVFWKKAWSQGGNALSEKFVGKRSPFLMIDTMKDLGSGVGAVSN